MIGTTVGSYRITHELGSGGMGVVYAAEHVVLKSKAAVKVLQPRHSTDKEVVTRFFNEARAATRIRHPGIVQVFDFGNHDSGSAYLVMELLEGETLAQRIKRGGRMSWRQALVVARQTAGALDAAHRAGIVHRDLKPHNLFLVRDPDLPGGERVKVLDFGIAKLASPAGGGGDDTTGHTREGALLGTPKYMSPEQCRGAARVDARADVYSLGCVLYAMICGEPPFSGEGSGEVMAKQIYEPPPPPSQHAPDLDAAVEELVLECLEKDPAARPASMHELGETLDTLLGRTTAGPLAVARRVAGSAAAMAASTLTATSTSLGAARGEAGGRSNASADSTPGASSGHITTLGASAAQIGGAAPATSGTGTLRATRTWRALVAVVGVGVLGSAGLLLARGGLSGGARTEGAGRDAGTIAALQETTPSPVPPPAPAAIVDAATVTSLPGVTRVKLRITSRPSGAAVVRVADGEWLGQTPITLSVIAAEGSVDLALRLHGYADSNLTLRTDVDGERDVALVADAAAGKAKSPGKPRPAARATTQPPAAGTTPAPAAPARPESHPILDGTLDPFGDSSAPPDAAR